MEKKKSYRKNIGRCSWEYREDKPEQWLEGILDYSETSTGWKKYPAVKLP
jgi:hypothetical protein